MFGFAVSACTPRAGTHGDPLVRDRVSSIVPGVHSRDDVAAILGSPSTNLTAGNELSLAQEFLGNIGRFNKNEGEAGSRR